MARIIAAFTQFFDNAGNPLIDGKLQFLESGTNDTDKNTFKDAALTPGMENTNPVILDGAGRLAFSVFGTGTYNVILFNSDDVQIQQFDPVGATTSGSQFSVWLATETYDKGDIVRATDNEYYQSFINDNNNNNPISNPTTWDLITIVKSYIANASGTVDAITADFVPVMHSLADGNRVLVRASGPNATTTPTFAPNGLTAKTIVKNGNQALAKGDIFGAGHELDMVRNLDNDNWELLNPSSVRRIVSAWANINATGVISIRDSENISSVNDNGVGQLSPVFAQDMDNLNYALGLTPGDVANGFDIREFGDSAPRTLSTFKILTVDITNNVIDVPQIGVIVLGGID